MRAFFKGAVAYATSFAGSRALMAVFGLMVVAFLAHAVAIPTRLPPAGFISLSAIGLAPPPPQFVAPDLAALDRLDPETRAKVKNTLREQAIKASGSAESIARDKTAAYLKAHQNTIPTLNMIGFFVGMIGLVITIAIHAGSIAAAERRARRPV
jgi:hypothetical protein